MRCFLSQQTRVKMYTHMKSIPYLDCFYVVNKNAHKNKREISYIWRKKDMSNVTGGGGALVLRIMTQLV